MQDVHLKSTVNDRTLTIDDLDVELLDIVFGFGHRFHRMVWRRVCRKWRDRRAPVSCEPPDHTPRPPPPDVNYWKCRKEPAARLHFAEWAIKQGHVGLLKWAVERGCPHDHKVVIAALAAGDFGLFRWLTEKGNTWVSERHKRPCFDAAARAGLVDAIEWFFDRGYIPAKTNDFAYRSMGYEAASGGHVTVLEVLHQRGCTFDAYTAREAVRHGHTGALAWLVEHGCPIDVMCCEEAAARGDMDTLAWLKENGYPLGGGACARAAIENRLGVLEWLTEQDCPWRETSFYAAEGGHEQLLKWAISRGCPWNKYASVFAALRGHLQLAQWCIDNGCPLVTEYDMSAHHFTEAGEIAENDPLEVAARTGRLDIMTWLMARGCRCTEGTFAGAAEYGRFDVMQWINDHHIPWNADVCYVLAFEGHLEALRYVRERGCPWDERVCKQAIQRGRLDVLRWAVENGCPWRPDEALARCSCWTSVVVARWLRERGCPWRERYARDAASIVNEPDLLKYAVENGCPWNPRECLDLATRYGRRRVAEWIASWMDEHGVTSMEVDAAAHAQDS